MPSLRVSTSFARERWSGSCPARERCYHRSVDLKFAYKRTVGELLSAREFTGGCLAPGVEADYVNLLDRIWEELAPEAQDELERMLLAPHRLS